MKWSNKIEIDCSIERVWQVLNEEKYLKKIKPQVVKSELLPERTTDTVRVYFETYREGKREESYELTVRTVIESADEKEQTFDFVIANMIASQGTFHLRALGKERTIFSYSGVNTGVNLFGKVMLAIASLMKSDAVVKEFLQKVKIVAESLDES